MSWSVEYLPEAFKELADLDGSVKPPVLKAIKKVSENPLSDSEGGYGKPLGNHSSSDLAGFMKIIIISARSDDKVYIEAEKRIKKYDM